MADDRPFGLSMKKWKHLMGYDRPIYKIKRIFSVAVRYLLNKIKRGG